MHVKFQKYYNNPLKVAIKFQRCWQLPSESSELKNFFLSARNNRNERYKKLFYTDLKINNVCTVSCEPIDLTMKAGGGGVKIWKQSTQWYGYFLELPSIGRQRDIACIRASRDIVIVSAHRTTSSLTCKLFTSGLKVNPCKLAKGEWFW